jgi:hypothetical protein
MKRVLSVVLTLPKIGDNVTEIENHSLSGVERSTVHGLLSFAVAAIFISPAKARKSDGSDNSLRRRAIPQHQK